MRFLTAAHTDVGIFKKVNQDAFCLKIAKGYKHNIAFAVLCDGMGGLENGELASAYVVNAFSAWFENDLPNALDREFSYEWVKSSWNSMVILLNNKIKQLGKSKGISMGTTLSAILIIDNTFMYVHVGDSRIYQINETISQVTKDQTLVAYEVEQKRLTLEQAKVDRRQNVLLQCIGASETLVPEIGHGEVGFNEEFLLCSDGFRHQIDEMEMYGVLSPYVLTSEKVMKKSLVDLVELNKKRNEKDNITALMIRCIK